MKYIQQPTPFDCGPVALANLLIWLGKSVNYEKNHELFKRLLKFKEEEGTVIFNFTSLIRSIKRKKKLFVNIIELPTIKDLRKNVADNKSVILGIDYKNFTHVGLIVKIDKNSVYLANWWGKTPVRCVHINTLRRWISKWSIAYCFQKA